MKILYGAIISSLVTSSTLFGVTIDQNSKNNSLVVYSNIGLVHEQRELNLAENDNKIIYEGVASSINIDSVNINLPTNVSLFSQQYRYDKLTKQKLLNAHIGKTIDVRVKDNAQNFQTIEAILLSNDGTSSIVKTKDNLIISVENKNIIFKTIPDELITKPSLVWNVKTDSEIQADMSIDYLINRIKWRSNYILNLTKEKAELSGWITIDNNSGKAFKDTNLYLLAGDINRVREHRVQREMVKMLRVADSSPNISQQAHEGYHFYTVPFKVTLANNEKTQLKFISQKNLDIKREYSSRMNNPNYFRGEIQHNVTQYITLKGLEYPLPKGVVRTYSKLGKTNILLGESSIQHTPKNTTIKLKLGKNFDVKVKETMLNYDDGTWNLDVDIKYSIKNSSDKEKNVEILVPFNKNSGSKVSSDENYRFTKGNLVTFNITVKPQSTKEFKAHFKTKK